MGCGTSTVKCLLFLFNFIFLLSGIALIAIGSLVQVETNNYEGVIASQVSSASIVFIVIGCAVSLISFLGCCGAITENRCMILTFAAFLALLIIIQLALGILIFVYETDIDESIHDHMVAAWEKYNPSTSPALTAVIDNYQRTFQCCGVNSYTDWTTINIGHRDPLSLPDSCCKNTEMGRGCGTAGVVGGTVGHIFDTLSGGKSNINYINTQGCFSQLKNSIRKHFLIVAGVALGVSVVEVIGLIFACYLASSLDRNKRLRNFV